MKQLSLVLLAVALLLSGCYLYSKLCSPCPPIMTNEEQELKIRLSSIMNIPYNPNESVEKYFANEDTLSSTYKMVLGYSDKEIAKVIRKKHIREHFSVMKNKFIR